MAGERVERRQMLEEEVAPGRDVHARTISEKLATLELWRFRLWARTGGEDGRLGNQAELCDIRIRTTLSLSLSLLYLSVFLFLLLGPLFCSAPLGRRQDSPGHARGHVDEAMKLIPDDAKPGAARDLPRGEGSDTGERGDGHFLLILAVELGSRRQDRQWNKSSG